MPRPEQRVSIAADDAGEARPAPECPFCGSREAELLSLFGSQAILLQYRCADCGSMYEANKYVDVDEPRPLGQRTRNVHRYGEKTSTE